MAAAKKASKKEEPGKKVTRRDAETEGHVTRKSAIHQRASSTRRGEDPSSHRK